jgi:hypothetical protein
MQAKILWLNLCNRPISPMQRQSDGQTQNNHAVTRLMTGQVYFHF